MPHLGCCSRCHRSRMFVRIHYFHIGIIIRCGFSSDCLFEARFDKTNGAKQMSIFVKSARMCVERSTVNDSEREEKTIC